MKTERESQTERKREREQHILCSSHSAEAVRTYLWLKKGMLHLPTSISRTTAISPEFMLKYCDYNVKSILGNRTRVAAFLSMMKECHPSESRLSRSPLPGAGAENKAVSIDGIHGSGVNG